MHNKMILLMCNIHKNSLLFLCPLRCIIIPEIRKDDLKNTNTEKECMNYDEGFL